MGKIRGITKSLDSILYANWAGWNKNLGCFAKFHEIILKEKNKNQATWLNCHTFALSKIKWTQKKEGEGHRGV